MILSFFFKKKRKNCTGTMSSTKMSSGISQKVYPYCCKINHIVVIVMMYAIACETYFSIDCSNPFTF